MPEVEFTIDPESGELTLHVKGALGPACDDVAKLAEELLGEPGHEAKTAEYHQQVRVRPRIRPKGSQ